MNILYCGDENIAQGLMLSVLSLMDHVREPLHIFVLTMGAQLEGKTVAPLPEAVAAKIDRRLKQQHPESSASVLDITQLVKAQPPVANVNTRFTPCCMLRLYADLVPQLPERILYLDNDVLCRGPFEELYYRPMEGVELAGVLDHYGKWFFRRRLWKMDYLNSGVLLLDLRQIRRTGLFEKCRRRCAEKKMFMPDQSALNKLAKAKEILPRRYNEQRKLRPDTVFQHFTTSFRFFPWFRTVSVKPWQTERMHSVLKLHEYDGLLARFEEWKGEKDETCDPGVLHH